MTLKMVVYQCTEITTTKGKYLLNRFKRLQLNTILISAFFKLMFTKQRGAHGLSAMIR